MACSIQNLTCSNNFGVRIGFDYKKKMTIEGEDFTGRTFHFVIKDADGVTLFDLTNSVDDTTSGIYVSNPTEGELFIIIKATDTDGMADTMALYEFYYETVSDKDLLFEGHIQFDNGTL